MAEPIRAFVARISANANQNVLSATIAAPFFIEVVDQTDQPLQNEEFIVYQDGAEVLRGTLDSGGRAFFLKIDRTKPFRFHIPGRVCAIVYGLKMLNTTKPALEHGGVFFDWEKSDGDGKGGAADADAAAFWADYRTKPLLPDLHDGPISFWQHEHLVRRDVAITRLVLDRFPAEIAKIKAIPVRIRVGPLVRFTDAKRAVIWVELETPSLVRVRFAKNKNQEYSANSGTPSDILPEKDFERAHGITCRVGGRHFAAIVLAGLEEKTLYDYTLDLAPLPAVGKIPIEPNEFGGTEAFLGFSEAVKENTKLQLSDCCFRKGSRFMSFRTLRTSYDDRLRFGFCSCRKWPYDKESSKPDAHYVGPDMMDALGSNWLPDRPRLHEWPSFLLLTGDQIYADDLGEKTRTAILAQRFAANIPGPDFKTSYVDGAWTGRFANRYIQVPTGHGKWFDALVAGEKKKRDAARAALDAAIAESRTGPFPTERVQKEREFVIQKRREALAVAEKDLDYLSLQFASLTQVAKSDESRPRYRRLVGNHLLWHVPLLPEDVPNISELMLRSKDNSRVHAPAGDTRGVHAADFAEYAFMYESAWGHPGGPARKVLAHIPTFMTFDDHEVTDDWNCDAEWIKTVTTTKDKKQHWPATITDALIAYWVYQGWGNTDPDEWKDDPRTKILLNVRSSGMDALPALRQLVRPLAFPPAADDLSGFNKMLTWHYTLPIKPLFIVTDCRTRRRLPDKPPAYDSDSPAFRHNQALDPQQLNWISTLLVKQNKHAAAFFIFQTPMILPHSAQWAMSTKIKWIEDNKDLRRGRDFEHMASDKSWDDVVSGLRNHKFPELKSVVILSGDVHHAYNAIGEFTNEGSSEVRRYPEILQIVSSGCRQALTQKSRSYLLAGQEVFSNNTTFRGLKIQLTGMTGADETKQNAVLLDNNFAIVEVLLDDKTLSPMGGGTYVALVEEYITQGAYANSARKGKPKYTHFWYRLLWDDTRQVTRAWEMQGGDTSADWWGHVF